MSTAKIFGYIRVSSKDQNLDRQIDSLKQYVPDERDIYSDKLSGKDFNRPAYQTLKAMLRPGDTLYIHEMERLGRNKKEVMDELRFFKEHDVVIRILNLPTTLLDFTQYDSKLQKMLNQNTLQVLQMLRRFSWDVYVMKPMSVFSSCCLIPRTEPYPYGRYQKVHSPAQLFTPEKSMLLLLWHMLQQSWWHTTILPEIRIPALMTGI